MKEACAIPKSVLLLALPRLPQCAPGPAVGIGGGGGGGGGGGAFGDGAPTTGDLGELSIDARFICGDPACPSASAIS